MKKQPPEISLPDWKNLTPAFARTELPRLLREAEEAVAAIEKASPASYEGLIGGISDATRELWRLWGMVGHMTNVRNSAAWREAEEALQPLVVSFSLRVGQSRKLHALAKALLARLTKAKADPMRVRIVEKTVLSARLAGVGLVGRKRQRFNEIQTRLAALAMAFQNAVLDATKKFSLKKGGKTYTIDDANYPETMKHCADRKVRERLLRARSVRAPENAARIDEILALRAESAALLGFANYAELSLAMKSAPSVAAVLTTIAELDDATVKPACAEESELVDEAKRLGLRRLEPWDRSFVAERLRERKYAYSEETLKRHFELEEVLKGLFRLVKFLFGVEVREVKGASKPSVWHPDVRFFAVRERGSTIAHFYFDPFVRNGEKSGGAWMNDFRSRRVAADGTVTLPLAVVVTNFPERDAHGRCYLPFREVETLFHEFGHALQAMLTRVDDEEASGLSLIEWDAVEVASQFMENWTLDDRTGIAVPARLKAKVRAAKTFRAATACRRQLAFAKTDLLLHANLQSQLSNRKSNNPLSNNQTIKQSNNSPNALKCEQFAHFGVPMVPEDRFLCAFTHIFAGGYAAGYYGYKWAEILSADCYGAFEEAGLSRESALRRIGRRYRETILACGGSLSALDVFRAFRKRDPKIDSLIRAMGL